MTDSAISSTEYLNSFAGVLPTLSHLWYFKASNAVADNGTEVPLSHTASGIEFG